MLPLKFVFHVLVIDIVRSSRDKLYVLVKVIFEVIVPGLLLYCSDILEHCPAGFFVIHELLQQ